MTMDIDCPKGTKVVFLNKNGYESDRENANKYLVEGRIYTVDYTEIGSRKTNVYLEGFTMNPFNSEMFEEYKEDKEVKSNLIKASEVNVTSNKVKLSKKIADALEEAKKNKGLSNSQIVENHVDADYKWVGICYPLMGLSTDGICKALYIGYEVEKTPEEELLEIYKTSWKCKESEPHINSQSQNAFRTGVQTTLDIFGIKVKGINE